MAWLPKTSMRRPRHPVPHHQASGARPRRPAWRGVACAAAASLITAAGLGPLSASTLGADQRAGSSTSTRRAATAPATSTSGAANQEAAAEQPSPIVSTTPSAPTTSSTPTSAPPPDGSAAPLTNPPPAAAPTQGPTAVQRRRQRTGARKRRRRSDSKHARPTKEAPRARTRAGKAHKPGAGAAKGGAAAANNVALPPQLVAAQARALAAELAGSAASAEALSFYRVPPFLLPIYQAASLRYGVPWQILAAINEVETNYGNDLSISTAGAVGWMQFMPATWSEYGVDALEAGYADPYNPVDAIFAAARYLRAAGASSDLRTAILAYNHSAEYVNSVLLRAKLISTYPKPVIATLTGLVDARPPVTGTRFAWNSSPSLKSSGATPGPRLVDVMSVPNAAAVAVQDGRIIRLGSSRKLGDYVILRDVNGDVFTYAGLRSVARSYTPANAPCGARAWRIPHTAAGAQRGKPASPHAATPEDRHPITLKVKTPRRRAATPRCTADTAASQTSAPEAAGQIPAPAPPSEGEPGGPGKVRLFAHPGNPDALAYAAGAERASRSAHANGPLPLRRGSVVAQGTVLGRVRRPRGARAGHLRFGIRPRSDRGTVDPRPVLRSWVQLTAALHPQGTSPRTQLLGATASGVFLFSESELQRAVLSDPAITLSPCASRGVANGLTDKRVLAMLVFLSRIGLKPTASGLRCAPAPDGVPAAASTRRPGRTVDISEINGIPIAGHQGAGSVTDLTITALLALKGEFAPQQIISLMHYPGASNTLAVRTGWSRLHVGFRPARVTSPLSGIAAVTAAHRGSAQMPPPPPQLSGDLSAAQWNQLMTRIAGLQMPTVAIKPSPSAIDDSNR